MAALDRLPPREWLQAFEAQANEPDFLESMERYARGRARYIAVCGGVVDETYAHDLVQAVLLDTIDGVISWDPLRVSLRKHVLDALQSRSRHEAKRARKRRHTSIAEPSSMAAAEHALGDGAVEGVERAELVDVVSAVVERVRSRAAGDVEVLLLIDAYAEGATTKAEAIAMMGLSELQYDAARKRLRRFTDELPQYLRNTLRPR